MIWSALQFDCPMAAWLLFLALPIAGMFYYLHAYRQKQLHKFASQSVLDTVLEKRDPLTYWIKSFLFCLTWLFAVFALMQPKGNERYVSSIKDGEATISKKSPLEKTVMRKKAHEVIFLVDASASMKVEDNLQKNRLEMSKEIVDDIIRHLQGENVSLYAFTSATVQVVPSTLDYLFTRLMLREIAVNEGETEGTNIKQALEFLRKRYFEKPSSKTKTLVILSDGGDTRLEGLNSEHRKQAIAEIAAPIEDALDKELKVFVVGLGELKGKIIPGIIYKGQPVISSLEEALLQKLTSSGKGELYLTKDMAPLQISQMISRQIARRGSFVDEAFLTSPSEAGKGTRVYDYYFQFPLAIAILTLIGYLLIPDTHKRKMKGVLSLFFVFSNLELPAQGSAQALNEASEYFEAQDFSRSQKIYEDLLDEEMDQWQQQILSYNIATAMLAAYQKDEAAVRLDMLVNQQIALPLLKQKVTTNLVLARLLQLKQQMTDLKGGTEITYLDYNRIFMLFYKIFQNIEKAEMAWCELDAAEGSGSCTPSADLQKMRTVAENDLKLFLEENQKTDFNFAKGPIKDALQQLSILYGMALIRDPLKESDLERIFEDQKSFESILKENSDDAQIANFESAQKYLQLSIESLKTPNPINTRIFAEAARFYILSILEQMDPNSKNKPKIVLENAITKEELILLLENLKGKGGEKGSEEVNLLLPKLQQQTLNNADSFLKAALNHQKENYRPNNPEKSCQCYPWDEVIPLFSDGYARAELANQKLQQSSFNSESVQHLQKVAIDRWKEALVKLDSVAREEKAKEKKTETQETQQKEQPHDQDKANEQFVDIQRLVQDMERDDHSRPQQVKASSDEARGESRPW